MNSNEIEDMSITIKMFGRQYTISLIFRLRENAGSACITPEMVAAAKKFSENINVKIAEATTAIIKVNIKKYLHILLTQLAIRITIF